MSKTSHKLKSLPELKKLRNETGYKHNQKKEWQVVKPEHLVDIEKFNQLLYNDMDVSGAYNKIKPNSKKPREDVEREDW
jgi:hypothetical protein